MPSAGQLLAQARTQRGKPYVFGATARVTDPDPAALDCSELVKWSAGRLGVSIPDGAINQYNDISKRGLTLAVADALRTPGAVIFKHGIGRHAPIYHVGISEGNGRVFEAKGSAYGVGSFPAGTWAASPAAQENCWNLAGRLPGFDYGAGAGSGAAIAVVIGALAAYYLKW